MESILDEERVFLVVVIGLLVWIIVGRTILGLFALIRANERQSHIVALLNQTAGDLAKQKPEAKVEEFVYLLHALEQRMSKSSYEVVLEMLQVHITDRLASSRSR